MSAEQSDLFGQRIGYMPTAPRVSIEHWIARRLGRPDLLSGTTTHDERRERIRQAILHGQHEEAIAGKRSSGWHVGDWRFRVAHRPVMRRENE